MEVIFEKVLERDIDFLIMNSFVNNDHIAKFIKNKFNLNEYETAGIYHSDTDFSGETDILIILEHENKRFALLLEDKVDATAQPDQAGRYIKRAKAGTDKGRYDDYAICMIAPQTYLDNNVEAKKYPNFITYEELLSNADTEYQKSMFHKALDESKNGYVPIEDSNVTAFWHSYYDMVETRYKGKLQINRVEGPRGSNAAWPELKTGFDRINIIHKSNRGYLDLTFPNMAENMELFGSLIAPVMNENYQVVKTNKSMAIRKIVPKIDFKESFDSQYNDIIVCLSEAVKLSDLLRNMNLSLLYEDWSKKGIQSNNPTN